MAAKSFISFQTLRNRHFENTQKALGVTLKISYLNGTADHDGFFSEDESLSHDGARWDDTVVVYVLLIGSSL